MTTLSTNWSDSFTLSVMSSHCAAPSSEFSDFLNKILNWSQENWVGRVSQSSSKDMGILRVTGLENVTSFDAVM